ncbi:hypothetical protein TKK_0003561 [Trichogramma kaykai]
MADKIKALFTKKVKDQKFKSAGKGYKLTDSASSSASTSKTSVQVTKRDEPSREIKVAGQAALARLEGQKTNVPKMKTSHKAIVAQAKKELELEKLALEQTEKSSESNEVPALESKIDHVMAVEGVYFQCPVISEEVLDRASWIERIPIFLHEELPESEPALIASLIINSCNVDADRVTACKNTLGKYLDNIIKDPSDSKYWKIKMSNKIFKEKVEPITGSIEFLTGAGFVREVLMLNDGEEEFLVWHPEVVDIEQLKTHRETLDSTEKVELTLDRNEQVLQPHQAAQRNELPIEFYKLTVEDMKRELELRAQAAEKSSMLMTQAMREKFMKQKERKYCYSIIRIRFPDNIILQGTFDVHEKYEEVVKFVQEHLANQDFPFFLMEIGSREKLTKENFEDTLESLNLVPAVILTFFSDSLNTEAPTQYLKDETLARLQFS